MNIWLPTPHRHVGGFEYLFTCYSCHKAEKFSWNIQKEAGHCLSCKQQLRGGTRGLQYYYPEGSSQEVIISFRDAPTGYSSLFAWEDEGARAYLSGRGVSEDLARACKVTYGDGRVWFPVHSPLGLAPFCLGRSIDPSNKLRWLSYPAEKGKYLFGEMPTGDTVILVEGCFKVLTPGLWGKAVATLGSSPSVDILVNLALRYTNIALWFDPDVAGRKGAEFVYGVLNGWFPDHALWGVPNGTPPPDDCTPAQARDILGGYWC